MASFWDTDFGRYLSRSGEGLARGANYVRRATDPTAAAQVAAGMLPGAGIAQGFEDFGRAGQALRSGDYAQALIDYGYGALNAGGDMIPAMAAMPPLRRPGANIDMHPDTLPGVDYYRRTAGASPDTGVGYMQFADDPGRIEVYGPNLHGFSRDPNTDIYAGDSAFRRAVYRALREYGNSAGDIAGLENTPAQVRQLVEELNPKDIVDSAGIWDNPDLVAELWNRVIDPRGAGAVITDNGAVVFDPTRVRSLGSR